MGLGLVEWGLNWWNGTWTGGMGLELVEWGLDWWNGTWTGILQVWESKSLFIRMYFIDTHFSQPD